MATPQRSLHRPRRRQEGLGRGDQEGLPQARAPVPPGPQPRRREGRGALQGDQRGLRPALATPRSAPRTIAARASSAAARAPNPFAGGGFDGGIGDILSNLFGGGGGGGAAARAARAAARARARPRGGDPDQLRPGGARRPGAADDPRLRALHDLQRDRRAPRHEPERLPALRGPRHRVPGAGHVLDLPAVLALRRQRHRDRVAVPDLQRHRRDARRQAPAREHPRRRARRQPDPPRRQGRGRAARRSARRSLRDHARHPVTGLHAEGRSTSRSRCR